MIFYARMVNCFYCRVFKCERESSGGGGEKISGE